MTITLPQLARSVSAAELEEMTALGMIGGGGPANRGGAGSREAQRVPPIARHAIHAYSVLNEAYEYARPSSFSRGIRFDLGDKRLLLISGTASIDEEGRTRHAGDFRAQLWRTYRNLTELLAADGATWHDVVRTTCYLRDIERDYDAFNEIRTALFVWLGLDPLPASTGIQARLCRSDLLVEIELMAVISQPSRD